MVCMINNLVIFMIIILIEIDDEYENIWKKEERL